MKFNTIIIGGGLSGLTAAIQLQLSGESTAVISAGQSALHFSSGTFGILNSGAVLPEGHPYSKIGPKLQDYIARIKPFFAKAGVSLHGDDSRNMLRLTPTGTFQECRYAMEEVELFDAGNPDIGNKVLIVNVQGFFDFNTAFIAQGLEKAGATCRIESVSLPEFGRVRESPSEMRSVNLARILEGGGTLDEFIASVKALIKDEDTVILPEIFGLRDSSPALKVKESLGVRCIFVGTMPPSVPGIRCQMQLRRYYESLGGIFLMGDEAVGVNIADSTVKAVSTKNLGAHWLMADNFILSTGSFFSKGLASSPEGVTEPLFGVDTSYDKNRPEWYRRDFFESQPYMEFGVATDGGFHAIKDGVPLTNLYAAGSILAGRGPLTLGCGAGVAILTAFAVADSITGGKA